MNFSHSGTEICVCSTLIECKSKNDLSSDVNTVAKDEQIISDFKDFPDLKLSMLSVPSFTYLFPALYEPVHDTSNNVFKHFPTNF